MIECASGCGTYLTGRQKRYCSERCKKLVLRDQWLRKIYDITIAEYQIILNFQDGTCGICRRPPVAGRSLAVDHHHLDGRSGPVRGLLCFFCNKRILGARTPDIIYRTAEYLRDPPAVRALGLERTAPGRPKKKRQPKRRGR